MLHMSFFDQDGCERADNNWRNILEDMLQLPDVREGGGILECIRKALRLHSSGSSENANMINIPEDTTESKGRCEEHYEMQGNSQRLGGSDMSKTTIFDKVDVNGNTSKCQNILLKILCSEKFSLLCDLLCGSLVEKKALEMVDFSLINSKMKSGDYEQSPGLFEKDIQQVWEKLKKTGQLMFHLASSLSNLSLASIQKQVGEDLLREAGDQKFEEMCEVGVEQRNSMDSNTATQFLCYELDQSTKPEQTEGSCLYKVCTCKQCGNEADGKRSLICDGCEAMYHFSCIEPAVQEISSRIWYCASCMANRKATSEFLCGRKSPGTISNCRPEPLLNNIQQDKLHENCVVCDRLDVAETQECPNKSGKITLIANDSRESSVSSMESDEPPEPSRTAMLLLCKKCGTCEDDNKRFLVCGNTQCPYKFYHIRCLKTNQIAITQQQNLPCWYCPSCLCRSCFDDKDDDQIVFCDGCDEAYHIYCMEPPRTSIPKGQWYCISCNVNRAKEGMRKYEQMILQHHSKKAVNQANEVNNSMDILLKAAEKLSSEERLQECPNKSGKITLIANDSRESSVSSTESDEPPEPSRTTMLLLCKKCGTCEDDNKRFLVCGNTQCAYKFYHIRCLKTNQIAIPQQKNLPCWYCPSCLCRSCFDDKDDDQIVFCDGCDEAYHIYCMEPPRTSISKGQWYCISCINSTKEGMQKYEQMILQHHSKKDVSQANEVNNSMVILLKAAEKLSSEEQLKARRLNK